MEPLKGRCQSWVDSKGRGANHGWSFSEVVLKFCILLTGYSYLQCIHSDIVAIMKIKGIKHKVHSGILLAVLELE